MGALLGSAQKLQSGRFCVSYEVVQKYPAPLRRSVWETLDHSRHCPSSTMLTRTCKDMYVHLYTPMRTYITSVRFMYVCMYVCMYVQIYIYIYVNKYIYIYMQILACMCCAWVNARDSARRRAPARTRLCARAAAFNKVVWILMGMMDRS